MLVGGDSPFLVVSLTLLLLSPKGSHCFVPSVTARTTAATATALTSRAMRLPRSSPARVCRRVSLLVARPRQRPGLPWLRSTSTLVGASPLLHCRTVSTAAAWGGTCPTGHRGSSGSSRQWRLSTALSTSAATETHGHQPVGGAPSPTTVRRAVGSNMNSTPQDSLSGSSASSSEDTIFALATGNAGPAGVAVVRISGSQSAQVLEALTCGGGHAPASQQQQQQQASVAGSAKTVATSGPRSLPFPAARRAVVRRLYDPASGDLLDEALVLWMPGPRSFTGEDTVELHTHGSRAVINGVLDALAGIESSGTARVRLAERGEFTQRAYGNGRMDLTGVEGLADLIAADTAAQRKQALKQMGGALRDIYEEWRHQLKGCLAHAEAVIDFGDDEEDVGGDAAFAAMMPRVNSLAAEIDRHLRDGGRGEIVRSGVRVAIVGPPNAGKSSLLNLLAARPAAIVSPVAGTTRDVVEVQMDIAGLPVTLSDTAGLREATDDEIEREGMRRARSAVDEAHLAIFVVDTTHADGATALLRQLREEAATAAEEAAATAAERDDADDGGGVFGGVGGAAAALDDLIVVANKADLAAGAEGEGKGLNGELNALAAEAAAPPTATSETAAAGAGAGAGAGVGAGEGEGRGSERGRVWKLSCKTKEGLEGFMEHLEAEVRSRFQGATDDESPLITRRRHRQHVEACLLALRAAQTPQMPLDLAAEELRIASSELGRITGAVGVEELLDVIFRDFCIGK